MERYLIIGWGRHLVFKDTYQFMHSSLEQLCANLKKKGSQHFKHLRNTFPNEPADKMELILRKGVYPYDFMRSFARIEQRVLPSRQQFYNHLNQEECPLADYAHARRVWSEFACQNMRDYTEL